MTVVNRGYSAEDIEFQSLFPRSAKIESFSMIQNEMHYHGKKVSHQKAHEIVRRAAADGYNAGLYVPRHIEGMLRAISDIAAYLSVTESKNL